MERRGRYFVHRGGTYSERSEGKLRRIWTERWSCHFIYRQV